MTEQKDMNLLNEEDLSQVMGGYGEHVSKYDGQIGSIYYFVQDEYPKAVLKAILVDSWEKKRLIVFSTRMHKIKITEVVKSPRYKVGDEITICGDAWTMYKLN